MHTSEQPSSALSTKASLWIPGLLALIYFAALQIFLFQDSYLWLGLPIGIGVITFWIFGTRTLFEALIFLLPFSLNLRLGDMNLNLNLPSEPLIGLFCLFFILGGIFLHIKKAHIKHPITIAVLAYAGLMTLAMLNSELPMVSIKFTLVSTAYILCFYFLILYFLKENPKYFQKLMLLYGFSLLVLVIQITFINHSASGFNKQLAIVVVKPFFSDHTIYGACVAFMIPIVALLWYHRNALALPLAIRVLLILMFICFMTAAYACTSRAVWMSLLVAFFLNLLIQLKLKPSTLIGLFLMSVLTLSFSQETWISLFKKNKNDSKRLKAGIEEQFKSVTNIRSDVSNIERLNRWSCAVRMFNEKPWFGFGPGTYQFKYLAYQKGYEMTNISVTSAKNNYRQGIGGTAHSEYLLTLSESGVFTFLAYILIILFALYSGMKLMYYSTNKTLRIYTRMAILALSTYAVHGIFNNFLNTDKFAFLFWGALATLVILDQAHKQEKLSHEKK